MNNYLKNLNRIEFVITLACTGKCKHCSEGDHKLVGEHIDPDIAAEAVLRIAEKHQIKSVMTFGGEPLLYPEAVCKIHSAATEAEIPKRQLITNGYFSKDPQRIQAVASNLAKSGVNDVLLSVDAFHQETIPLGYVSLFAKALKEKNVRVRTHPAWLVSPNADNPYNVTTREILAAFAAMGIQANEGNVIFPGGNARKYLSEYFDLSKEIESPYWEDPVDIRAVCIGANGDLLGGNLYRSDVIDILESYDPRKQNQCI